MADTTLDPVSAAENGSASLNVYSHLPPSDPQTLAHVEDVFRTRSLASPIYAFLLSDLSIIHASRGLVVARLVLGPQHMNSSGSIHGAVSATMVDWAGGLCISAWDLRYKTGVSVDIHVTYLGGAKVGDVIELEGRAEKVGGSMAFTSVGSWTIVNGKRDRTVILGRHSKFVRGSAPFAATTGAASTTADKTGR